MRINQMFSVTLNFLAFCSVVVWGSLVTAAPTNNDLDKKLVGLKSFEGVFDQRTFNDKGDEISFAKGEISLKRPSKIYWQSDEPDRVIIVSNGHQLFHYDIELAQVSKQPVANALASSPALLIIGGEPLAKGYHIAKLDSAVCRIGKDCYELKSKTGDKGFIWMQVGFSPKQQLEYLSVLDNLSQLTIVKFSNIRTNNPIRDSLFDFKIPYGVDVIEGTF